MGDDSPDIGGDASPNALIEKLLERDGRSTWFNADEAHGLFKEMQSTTWRAGLREKWTQLYDGRVPMQQRNGNKDISGQDAKAHFTMDLMGTALGMMEVLDSDDWTSGFLARFVWSIGKELEVDPDDLEVDEQVGDVVAEYNAIPRAYAAEFRMAEIRFAGLDGEVPIPILLTPEAKARHQEVMREFTRLGAKHPQSEMVKPTLIRFQLIIRKCAALVAISEGSKVITLRHHLIALEQAEEWLGNMLAMVAATTASAFARQVDAVEQFIATQPAQEARVERVYRHLKTEKYLVDRLIEQLIAEGRIERERGIDNSVTLRMKRREAIAA